MRELLLLRHAKSSWDDPHLSDHARPLNLRGRQAAAAMAAAMRGFGLRPDVVLVSSARRTLQTLAALEPWGDPPPAISPTDALYLASAADLLDTIQATPPAARCVLVVAHNPGLHDLALALEDGSAAEAPLLRLASGYPSGALTQFAVGTPWSDLRNGGAQLTRFLVPSDLSEVDA